VRGFHPLNSARITLDRWPNDKSVTGKLTRVQQGNPTDAQRNSQHATKGQEEERTREEGEKKSKVERSPKGVKVERGNEKVAHLPEARPHR
jgi:hypothetical protein